jgi:hypothetical protein
LVVPATCAKSSVRQPPRPNSRDKLARAHGLDCRALSLTAAPPSPQPDTDSQPHRQPHKMPDVSCSAASCWEMLTAARSSDGSSLSPTRSPCTYSARSRDSAPTCAFYEAPANTVATVRSLRLWRATRCASGVSTSGCWTTRATMSRQMSSTRPRTTCIRRSRRTSTVRGGRLQQ